MGDPRPGVAWALAAGSAALLGLSLTGDGTGPALAWSYAYLLVLGLVLAWTAWGAGVA